MKDLTGMFPTIRPPLILMCPPDHFSVDYAINPWMDPGSWAGARQRLAAEARRQWRDLRDSLLDLGARIELAPSVPELPDLVFTANAALVMNGTALLAKFRHPERRREEAPFEQAFRRMRAAGLIDSVEALPEGMVLEGAGDCVWDRTRAVFWMGYGARSDAGAKEIVAGIFGLETVALELVNPRFYHMDTALCPLSGGEILYVPEAFGKSGLAALRDRVPSDLLIAVGPEDAAKLAANAICVGDTILLADCTGSLRDRLEERGYRVRATPLDAFRRSGGSAFCLTLRLDHRFPQDRSAEIASEAYMTA